MRRIVILLASLLLSSAFLLSQAPAPGQPSREELIKMFDVLRVRQQSELVMQTTVAQMKQQVRGDIQKRYPNLSQESAAKLENEINGAANLYPVSEMLEDLIPVYQKYLTKADVDAIVSFYSSPAGQHFLDQMPVVTREAMSTMMTKLQVRTAAYADKVQKEADEMQQEKN